ncbi:MAG TPA: filamentous hemagglutinin N-terminal domain-containing protein, partial [Rhodanobacter sp.]|nr:filamentous hemagglutinin N-terminal domain-containing protein [Rhodanobacter sp.]
MTTIDTSHPFRQGFNALAVAIGIALLGVPVAGQAQTVPDAHAGLHRPGMDTAANGTPVVNIVAPSAAGVSHNQFQSFDVDSKGLILNNSGAVSQTQLAGMIVGNTNLATGPSARIILNEVTGGSPSALNGYTEVAGKAADVIVANPNGISVNGGGFINTTRSVLTTGTPVFGGDGSLQAFRVTRGAIAINGSGLDGTQGDRLDLIARAVQANAKVWAHNLNVVTGANQVGYADLATQAIQGEGAVPGVSLDVAALGGMYADKIHLLGTEAGVGVRTSGEIAAQAGDFQLTSAGKLVVTGKLTATGDLAVDAGGIDNAGTLAANGRLDVHGNGDIGNSGTLYAGQGLDLSGAGAVSNAGLIHADADATLHVASLSNTGSIESAQDLSLTSQGRLINQGTMLAGGGDLALSAGEFDNSGSVNAADRLALQAGALNNTGLLRSGTAQTFRIDGKASNQGTAYAGTAAQWTVAGLLANTGTLAAQGDLDIGAGSLDSSGVLGAGVQTDGSLAGAGALSVDTRAALVAQGRNLAAATLDFHGASLDLDDAITRAGGAIGLTATQGTLSLRNGDLATNDNLALQVAGQLDNSGGTLQAGQIALDAASVVNRGGHVLQTGAAASTLAVSGAFDNSAGSIASNAGALTLNAGSLLNTGGSIAHAG